MEGVCLPACFLTGTADRLESLSHRRLRTCNRDTPMVDIQAPIGYAYRVP